MTVLIPIHHIQPTPGSTVTITNVSWDDFEQILEDLGDHRGTRVAYFDGNLEIMSPLPRHERPNRIITDLVKAMLDAQERDWHDFGSSTLRRSKKQGGVEPDTCFYIQNAALVADRLDIDLDRDPPPDLAIETDVTSKTVLEAYRALGVPEVWIYEQRKLEINLLQDGEYIKSLTSLVFPNLDVIELIPGLVEQAMKNQGKVIRELRQRLSQEQGTV